VKSRSTEEVNGKVIPQPIQRENLAIDPIVNGLAARIHPLRKKQQTKVY
jgi:hypothetical protein